VTTVAFFIIGFALAVLAAAVAHLYTRLGQHEDLMLDLRYLVSDLNETLARYRAGLRVDPSNREVRGAQDR